MSEPIAEFTTPEAQARAREARWYQEMLFQEMRNIRTRADDHSIDGTWLLRDEEHASKSFKRLTEFRARAYLHGLAPLCGWVVAPLPPEPA